MRTIRVTAESELPPERVLLAAYDFSARRADVFPAVSVERMEVHEAGATAADVTEGTSTGIGSSWERCRYDWSRPGVVTATVTDSNIYAIPGSVWELTARPRSGGGSEVEMTWTRRFKASVRGRLFAGLFRTAGSVLFRRYARDVLRNLDH